MEILKELFGEGKELTPLQMGCRALVVFFVTLVLIRIAGRRTFGKKSAFDNIIVIMLGAILSRAVAGVSPFLPTITASFVLVAVHRLLAWLSLYNKLLSELLKGKKLPLFENGRTHPVNMKKILIGEDELMEGVRMGANVNSFENIEKVFMEGSGQISVVKKTPG